MTNIKKTTPQQFKYGLPVDDEYAVAKPSPDNCQLCNYPMGDDWLDDGETCPKCLHVN